MDLVMTRDATISTDGAYRYRLSRRWDHTQPVATFIMLNPSTADATVDDATIRKCIGFAQRWRYGGIEVGNLFAFRATKPEDMKRSPDPVGPENWTHLEAICRGAKQSGGRVICAWGTNGGFKCQDSKFLENCIHQWDVRPMALRMTTKSRKPEHPLYVPYEVQPVHF